VEDYPSLTDAQALRMLDEYFQFRQAKVTLQTSYIPKFNQALPGKKTGRYYQIENHIDTKTDFELMQVLPLMK
jgi:hypothetical protein